MSVSGSHLIDFRDFRVYILQVVRIGLSRCHYDGRHPAVVQSRINKTNNNSKNSTEK